jgi:transcriptional regulator GlxA family with amidase domain
VQFLVDASTVPDRVDARPEELHRAVERAAAMLEVPRDPRWTLFDPAKRAALSPYELSRVFRKQLGVRLVHYANHQRVQLFGRLYAERPSATILQNALDAGFGSYSQIFCIFRAVTHLTLDKYRELCEDGTLPNLLPD